LSAGIAFLFGVSSVAKTNRRGAGKGTQELINQGLLNVEPLTYIRGRSIPNQFMIVDEAQNLTPHELKTIITRAGEGIDLAPKEFSILEYLMRHRGKALSRTMIVEHVWDMDYDGLTNIVDVYIRHLRSKIDDNYPVKLIHTVRGIGYMIDLPAELKS